MEKGSQCVGMKECKSDTVAIPPIVDRSSALKLAILSFNPQIQNPKPTNKQDYSIHLWIQIQLDTTTLRYPSHFR